MLLFLLSIKVVHVQIIHQHCTGGPFFYKPNRVTTELSQVVRILIQLYTNLLNYGINIAG
jgi:hypothetical protein